VAGSNVKIGNLSGYFAQLLRYTIPADTRSTIVRLRSARTARCFKHVSSACLTGGGRQIQSEIRSTKILVQNEMAKTKEYIGGKSSKVKRKKGCGIGRDLI